MSADSNKRRVAILHTGGNRALTASILRVLADSALFLSVEVNEKALKERLQLTLPPEPLVPPKYYEEKRTASWGKKQRFNRGR